MYSRISFIIGFGILFFFLFFIRPDLHSQTKRALLIGINTYKQTDQTAEAIIKSRRSMENLDGCINDICAVHSIIQSRYGFEEKNIDTVCNTKASREGILAALRDLLSKSASGDVVLIYYSGHGSLVTNSLSSEKVDQSIVPSDLIDIRDKELSVFFNAFADKGVKLTLIFDNCHSGSIARGSYPEKVKSRKVPSNPVDAKDPSNPPNPEDKGVLIFSACQPDEQAYETKSDSGTCFGAFTFALWQVLSYSPVQESANTIFSRAKAIMQQNGINQEPVIGGTRERREKGLFGEDVTGLDQYFGKTVVPVLRIVDSGHVVLQGGYALNLNPNCILFHVDNHDTLRLRVKEVHGLTMSTAQVVNGTTNKIKPGDLFILEEWTPADKPLLTVYYPVSVYSIDEIKKIAGNLSGAIRSIIGVTCLSDPTVEPASHFIQYYRGKWFLTLANDNININLGRIPDLKVLKQNLKKGDKVFIQLPPPGELINNLEIGSDSRNSAIETTQIPNEQAYVLAGRYHNDSISFAFVRPLACLEDENQEGTLPACTDWISYSSDCGVRLTDIALRLGKIAGWLSLQPPEDNCSFPFRLGLRNQRTKQYVASGSIVYEDDLYEVVLIKDSNALYTQIHGQENRRYVYIFSIDKTGKMTQIFPQNNINYGNRLPLKDYHGETEIPLGVRFKVVSPFGTDTYFMIATKEAITVYQAFNSSGVVTRGSLKGPGASDNALTRLLNNTGTTSRGDPQPVPTTWSIEKIAVLSKPSLVKKH